MNLQAKIKVKEEYKHYVKTLIISTALAFLVLYIAFGLMYFAKEGNPVPGPFVLLLLAIFFIVFTVFYESKGKEEKKKEKKREKESLKSLIKGLFLALCATFSFVAIIGGIRFLLYFNGLQMIGGFGSFISALAVCMIASMVFLSLLRPLPE
jgi:Ca2+/Na+ antiporter